MTKGGIHINRTEFFSDAYSAIAKTAETTIKNNKTKSFDTVYYMLNFMQQNIDNTLIFTYYEIIDGDYNDICCPLSDITSKLEKYICTFKSLMDTNGIKYALHPKGEVFQIKDIVERLSTACSLTFDMAAETLQNSEVEELHNKYILVYFVMRYVKKILSFMINEGTSTKTDEQKQIEKMYIQLNVCGSEFEKEMSKNGIQY